MTEVAIGFASRMPEIVRELQAEREGEDPNAVLLAIAQAATEAIPAAEFASVTMVTKGRIETPIAVGAPALKCDELQQELGEGPCVRAAVSDETIWIDDMRGEPRWPHFAQGATGIGIMSMACFCLYIDGNDFGALNLHSGVVDGFDSESRSMGELFAAHAAIALSSVREREQLRVALTSRDLIGQAKGMIMERYRIDADAAFRLLARLSQDSNTKLVEVARQVVAAGPDVA